MSAIKRHDLLCFDAVVREGSFQAAALVLHRSHPSVFAAVARLEQSVGLHLLDRSGYRVSLTEVGRAFHQRSKLALRELDNLESHAAQLARGEEPSLRVVIGDLCPFPPVLGLLSRFFSSHPATRLDLDYEAVGGPVERLLDGEADIVFHRGDPADPRLERVNLCKVRMVPVVAPGFLPFPLTSQITPEQMRPFTQCVIRDTVKRLAAEEFFLIEGTHRCSVPDHMMKKELILHRLAWGHLPEWLIESELSAGTLIAITGNDLPGRTEQIAAIRRRDSPHGPTGEALWATLRAENPDRS